MLKSVCVNNIVGLCNQYNRTNPELEAKVSKTENSITINFVLNKNRQREMWVAKKLEALRKNYPKTIVRISDPKRGVVVIEFRDHYSVYGTGVALCSANDKFDTRVGMAVAYAKWMDEKIPDFV